MAEPVPTTRASRRRGKILRIVVAILIVVVLAVSGLYLWRYLNTYESTDDAQVDGHIDAVSARISGQVVEVLAEDEKYVKAGDVLVRIDPKDYEVALTKAEADLADAEAALETSRIDIPITSATTSSVLKSANSSHGDATAFLLGAERQLNAAQATRDVRGAAVAEAEQNVVVAQTVIDQAKQRITEADASIESAKTAPQQVAVSETRAKSALAQVAQRRALVEQAKLNLSYCTIVAPATGIVGKKTVENGENVSPGQQLLAVVPLDDVWIIANFKETQLSRMKPGQRVRFTVDAYSKEYKGTIQQIGGASGSRFSLLPPENATGNYVKVVQRVPVRIVLDPGENSDHRLRPGLSVDPKVYVE